MIETLRLASAILESPASIAFIYLLMNEPREKLEEFSKLYFLDLFKFCDSKLPKTDKRRNVCDKLRQFAGKTRFEWVEMDHCYALTRRESSSANLSIGPPGSGKGHTSKIFLPQHVARAIITARLEPHRAGTCLLLRIQFLLAATICHEVIHALDLAVVTHTVFENHVFIEDYYCDQRLNELGYAWEVAVFGGVIAGMDFPTDYDTPIVVSNWPSLSGTDIALRIYDLTGLKTSKLSYFVLMGQICDIQQQTFWDAPSNDTNLLRLSKDVGWIIDYPGDDFDP